MKYFYILDFGITLFLLCWIIYLDRKCERLKKELEKNAK